MDRASAAGGGDRNPGAAWNAGMSVSSTAFTNGRERRRVREGDRGASPSAARGDTGTDGTVAGDRGDGTVAAAAAGSSGGEAGEGWWAGASGAASSSAMGSRPPDGEALAGAGGASVAAASSASAAASASAASACTAEWVSDEEPTSAAGALGAFVAELEAAVPAATEAVNTW